MRQDPPTLVLVPAYKNVLQEAEERDQRTIPLMEFQCYFNISFI